MLAQLREGQDAGAAVGEAGEGEGCVVVHAAEIPASGGPPNRCYRPVDKSGQDSTKVRPFDGR
ncbi:hypothetical protein GCM10010286_13820 [Streptomyces toxytricini]|nr:hypothetical protein GCM10010286_13820 [Streptomyces toxytricini]